MPSKLGTSPAPTVVHHEKKMKKYFQIIIAITSINNLSFSQTGKFEWQDSIFEIGQKREIKLLFDFDGPCTGRPCYKYEENGKTLDTLILFLKRNENLVIELGFHQEQRGSEDYNQKLSERYAKGTKKELLIHGIDEERIRAKGYGESMPIISPEEIKKMKAQSEKEKAWKINERIEIVILKI